MVEVEPHTQPLSAKAWLARLCRVLNRRDPRLTAWQISTVPAGVTLHLELDDYRMSVRVRPRDQEPAWATTRSLSLNISHSGRLPQRAEAFLETFRAFVKRADRPDLQLEFNSAGRARRRLADEIRRSAFIGWQTWLAQDDYPHQTGLGVPTPADEIVAGWRDTMARIEAGHAPAELGLYIHIPFCRWDCTFCMFSHTARTPSAAIESYVTELIDEIRRFGEIVGSAPIASVWFGGGTPSVLPTATLERLFTALHEHFVVPAGTQILFEADAGSLDADKIQCLAELGRVTRLTIGVQTLDPVVQKKARRFTKLEDVRAGVAAARRYGIDHVNIDLMAGLDGQTFDSFRRDAETIVSLKPDSYHANAFQPRNWTSFVTGGGVVDLRAQRERERMIAWAASQPDLLHMEDQLQLTLPPGPNSGNVQLEDYDRRNGSVLGLGLPALSHSFANHYYIATSAGMDAPMADGRSGITWSSTSTDGHWPAALDAYRRGERGYLALAVDEAEERHRNLVHSLRAGFSRSDFAARFGVDPTEVAAEGWQKLEDLGMLGIDGDRVVTQLSSTANWLTFRAFLYSERILDRADEVWGRYYDPTRDYEGDLRRLLGESR